MILNPLNNVVNWVIAGLLQGGEGGRVPDDVPDGPLAGTGEPAPQLDGLQARLQGGHIP